MFIFRFLKVKNFQSVSGRCIFQLCKVVKGLLQQSVQQGVHIRVMEAVISKKFFSSSGNTCLRWNQSPSHGWGQEIVERTKSHSNELKVKLRGKYILRLVQKQRTILLRLSRICEFFDLVAFPRLVTAATYPLCHFLQRQQRCAA